MSTTESKRMIVRSGEFLTDHTEHHVTSLWVVVGGGAVVVSVASEDHA